MAGASQESLTGGRTLALPVSPLAVVVRQDERVRYSDLRSVEQLVELKVSESTVLEYKREVDLSGTSARRELLKDLTGMANGGGGSIIYGVEEDGHGSASRVVALATQSVVGQMRHIVQAGVQPPLVWAVEAYATGDGWVIVAEVEPSGLGPYMVDGYNEQRYFVRIGTDVVRMSERSVRDAYALASRAASQREGEWQQRFLPLQGSDESPWLSLSAVPLPPLRDLFEGREVEPSSFAEPPLMANYRSHTDLGAAARQMYHWADGLAGETPDLAVRLHRNGAAGIIERWGEQLDLGLIARQTNAYLMYLAWYWTRFSLSRPVEVRARFTGLTVARIGSAGGFPAPPVRQPAGLIVNEIEVSEEILPWELLRAPARHRLIRRLIERLTLAYGLSHSGELFESGWLFDRSQRRTRFALSRGSIWHPAANTRVAQIDSEGRVIGSQGKPVLFLNSGALVDASGDTVALVEMAGGHSCPPEFVPNYDEVKVNGPGYMGIEPIDAWLDGAIPNPTSQWSVKGFEELLA